MMRASAADCRLDDLPGQLDASLRTLFQPVVELATGAVVGYEALTRGPAGSVLEQPDELFAAARRQGRLAELDWSCRCLAFRRALQASLLPPRRLFVNVEPEALGTGCPQHLLQDWVAAYRRLHVVVELTERCLLDRPAELLRISATLRELGWEVALDDVGIDDAGVALLPVLRPDVVKLDRSLLQGPPSHRTRRVLAAVASYVERSGAHVVAEGVETSAQHRAAVELGASWGQGYLLGRPATLAVLDPAEPATGWQKPNVVLDDPCADPRTVGSAFGLLPEPVLRRVLDDAALDRRIQEMAVLAEGEPEAAVVVACLGDRSAPERLCQSLDRLSASSAVVIVLAAELPRPLASHVRATLLRADDPLAAESAFVVLGPRVAAALVTRSTQHDAHEVLETHDPAEVAVLARALLTRTPPLPEPTCWR